MTDPVRNSELHAIARRAVQDGCAGAATATRQFLRKRARSPQWRHWANRFLGWLENPAGLIPTFSVFVKGNSKLPYYSFSALPLHTCPGAGDCASFCYSYKAWRYPATFFRQVQNTLIIREEGLHNQLLKYWMRIPDGATVRLYVDGDFDSIDSIRAWFRLLHQRSDIKAYGYSKSWGELMHVPASEWPENYKLNLSSGSNHDAATRDALLAHAPANVRGAFIAVETGRAGYDRDNLKEVVRVAREIGHQKVFACPGKCGECGSKSSGHACGSAKFDGFVIATPMH